jgi:hypothetical protein
MRDPGSKRAKIYGNVLDTMSHLAFDGSKPTGDLPEWGLAVAFHARRTFGRLGRKV